MLRFTRRLQIAIFSFSLIPSVLIIIISILSFVIRFDPFVRQTVAYDTDLYANKIQSYISEQFVQMHGVFENLSFLDSYSEINSEESPSYLPETHRQLKDKLAYYISMHPGTEAIYIEDANRNIIAYQDPLYPARTNTLLELPRKFEGYVPQVVSPVITSPAQRAEDVYIMLGMPLYVNDIYKGAFTAVLDLSHLRDLAQDPGMFDSTFRVVFDASGTIVATSNTETDFWSIADFDNISDLSIKLNEDSAKDHASGIINFTMMGKPSIGHYHHIQELGWTVFSGIATNEIYQPVIDSIPLFLFFTLLLLVALIFALRFISNQITHPVQTLIDGMEYIRNNDYYHHIKLKGCYEFSEIADSFNLLIDQVAKDTEQLKLLNKEFDNITTYIPGGLFKCSLDSRMSFLFTSDPFISLTGYQDRQTLLENSSNSFLQTIHPDDRDAVRQIIQYSTQTRKVGNFEYRIMGETGTRWLSCSFSIHEETSGTYRPVLFGMAIDATAMHEAFVQLRTSDERYRILLEQTDEAIFEWSILEDRFLFISREKNWLRMFGAAFPSQANLMIGDLYGMHPDDRARFASTVKTIVRERIRGTKIEVRLTRTEGNKKKYIWTRFLLTSMFDNHGKVERLAGRIQDIHEEKVESLRLIGLSQTDALTGLMNRRGFEATVERILDFAEPNVNRHVLIMIDVDNFKQINDTYGHLHGDNVLVSIAQHMKRIFRITDLFGRLGGDEFAAFLINFSDMERLNDKIELLLERLRMDNLPCSVGIAIYAENGDSFTELYKKADMALYRIKNSGKNGYAFAKDQSSSD